MRPMQLFKIRPGMTVNEFNLNSGAWRVELFERRPGPAEAASRTLPSLPLSGIP